MSSTRLILIYSYPQADFVSCNVYTGIKYLLRKYSNNETEVEFLQIFLKDLLKIFQIWHIYCTVFINNFTKVDAIKIQ